MTATSQEKRASWKEANTCPYCAELPIVQPWHGGGPRKTAVSCDNERCPAQPMVTGSTRKLALRRWNQRRAKSPDAVRT